MNWAFICKGLKPFDVTTIDNLPLGGTESALIYLMKTLVKLNHKIFFLADYIHDNKIQNIQQLNIRKLSKLKSYDIDVIVYVGVLTFIKIIKEENPKKPIIYWIPHAANQPSMTDLGKKETLNDIAGIVFLSNWQKKDFVNKFHLKEKKLSNIDYGISFEFQNMFKNFDDFKKSKDNNLGIYSSTPFRGLNVLLTSDNFIKKKNYSVDIFSSMATYREADDPYINLYNLIKKKKNFSLRGGVNKKILADNYKNKSFLFYPSTFAETFCSTTLDALAAGCDIITTNFGCLKETCMGYGTFLDIGANDTFEKFSEKYAIMIENAIIKKEENTQEWFKKQFNQYLEINKKHSWDIKVHEWIKFISSI